MKRFLLEPFNEEARVPAGNCQHVWKHWAKLSGRPLTHPIGDPMTIQDCRIKESLDRDGYCVVKDVFSAEEIARMRREVTAMLAIRASPHNGGISCKPERHESDLACRLLSDNRLAACGELPAIVHFHADTVHDWHVDLEPRAQSADREAGASIYKIAIYLQDHPHQYGLSVIPGSHKQGNMPRVPLHLGTRAGDIVIFDVRIRHAGRFPNHAERVMTTLAWWLQRSRLIDETGRHHLFRCLRYALQPRRAAHRLAVFLTFRTTEG